MCEHLAGFVPAAPLRSDDTAGFDLGSAEAGRAAGAVAGRVPGRETVGMCKDVVALTRVKPRAPVEPTISPPSALSPFAVGCKRAGSSRGAQVLARQRSAAVPRRARIQGSETGEEAERGDSSAVSLTPLKLPAVALPSLPFPSLPPVRILDFGSANRF